MTTEDRDPTIQGLFDAADIDLDDGVFTVQFSTRARRREIRFAAGWVTIGFALITIGSLLAAPLRALTQLLALGLTAGVVDLGEGGLALVLSPMNTIGSLLILSLMGLRMGRRRILRGIHA